MAESGREELVGVSTYLRSLLNGDEKYRGLWHGMAVRSGGNPNIDAVARVIAGYLWTYEDDLAPRDTSRALKDRIRRALTAQVLTPETLRIFMEAFAMSAKHRQRLQNLLANPIPAASLPAGRVATYRTLSLQELHFVGADGLPSHHRTIHAIQAIADGVSSYYYLFDTPELEVRATRGAAGNPVEPSENHEGFWQCRFDFDRPLSKGSVTTFEYETTFRYTSPPRRELRRGAGEAPLSALSLVVEFHPARLPSRLWFGEWNKPTEREPTACDALELDGYNSAHVFASELQHKVIGFMWDW